MPDLNRLIQVRPKRYSLHINFMLSNPELELVKDLHNTPYGKELMSAVARNQRRRPESGTGESIHDELERDSVDMKAAPQFQAKSFMIPGTEEKFADLDIERDDNGRIIKRSFDVYPIKIEYRYEYDSEGRLKNVYCERNTTEDYRYGEYGEEGDPVGMTYQDKEYLFATDQVGTIFMVADDQGRELKCVIYDSFGNLLVDTNKKLDTCVGFAAGLADKDTGLIHFGYRDYDPRIGSFITPDPIGLAGGDVDIYGYCLDDPINFVDRTGLAAKSETELKKQKKAVRQFAPL